MPKKKTVKAWFADPPRRGVYETALANVGRVSRENALAAWFLQEQEAAAALAEKEKKKAFLQGQEREAKEAYLGSGYKFHIQRYVEPLARERARARPATPARGVPEPEPEPESKWGPTHAPTDPFRTPVKARRPRTRTFVGSPSPVLAPREVTNPYIRVPQAPAATTIMTIGAARAQIGKAFGQLEPWAEPLFDVAGSLPVGEEIEVDVGPPSNPKMYHAKISRVEKPKKGAK